MKTILVLLALIYSNIAYTQELTQHQKDSVMNLAGNELRAYSRQMTIGFLLTLGGTLVMTVGALSPIKKTTGSGPGAVTTTKTNGPVLMIGGLIYLVGMVNTLSAPTRVSNAGYFLKLISGQPVVIPIKKKARPVK